MKIGITGLLVNRKLKADGSSIRVHNTNDKLSIAPLRHSKQMQLKTSIVKETAASESKYKVMFKGYQGVKFLF